nr:transposase [Salsuginibacillus kocurii]
MKNGSGGQESATGWKGRLRDLRKRGVEEVLLGVFDGLSGLETAFKRVFPKADVQRCIVHKMRNKQSAVRVKHREDVMTDLKAIYHSSTRDQAYEQFEAFKERWEKTYPKVASSWEEELPLLLTFYTYPATLHRSIPTTNMIECFMSKLKGRTKKATSFPTEQAAEK